MRRLTVAHCAEDGERVEVTFDPAYEDGDNTSVGYGAYEVTNGPGGHQFLYDDVRMVATGHAQLDQPGLAADLDEPGDGQRRHVLRRFRRPQLPGDTGTIAAITITGDAICRSTIVVYRLDTEAARAFLSQYVTLP